MNNRKDCRRCGKRRFRVFFGVHKSRPDGLRDWCRECEAKTAVERHPYFRRYRNDKRLKINNLKSSRGCKMCGECDPWKDRWESDCGRAVIYHGDCLEVLPTLAAGSVDAVVTDPPYSSGGAFRGDRNGSTASKYLGSYGSTHAGNFPEVVGDTRDTLGWAMWATLWLSASMNVSKAGAYCFVFSDWRQLPNCTSVLQSGGWVWRGIGVWDKGGSCRPMSGRLAHQAEYIPWGTHGPIGWDYSMPSVAGVFRSHAVSTLQRQHQTEKPIDVIEQLLRITGDTMLDPFVGSGSTAIACLRTGRRCIGIEIDKSYFDAAVKRVKLELVGKLMESADLEVPLPQTRRIRMGDR